jgi:peptidoglycan-associated lipoprotein
LEEYVNRNWMKWALTVAVLAMVIVASACSKKKPTPPPAAPPPPPPASPTATLTANPNTVNAGQPTTLTWQTSNASDVTIDVLGTVEANGSRQVTPTESTTYHLVAKGAGGTQDATARVTVTGGGGPQQPEEISLSDTQAFAKYVKDIYFDYDAYTVRAADQAVIQANAAFFKQHPNIHFTIEGHCDERGSTEYNLALGDNRASSAKAAIVQMGIPASSIRTISYGKEKPFCSESNEQCWQQNRRAHFVISK